MSFSPNINSRSDSSYRRDDSQVPTHSAPTAAQPTVSSNTDAAWQQHMDHLHSAYGFKTNDWAPPTHDGDTTQHNFDDSFFQHGTDSTASGGSSTPSISTSSGSTSVSSSSTISAASTSQSTTTSAPAETGAHATSVGSMPASTMSWSPAGGGPYTTNIANSTNEPQTVTLTLNGQAPVSKTLPPNTTMALTLPAGAAGNISSSGASDAGKPTLFEFSLGSGSGSQSFFDTSDIVGNNVSMLADGGSTTTGGIADSESTDLSHYVGPVDDNATGVNPMKSTFGDTLNLNIGSEALNTTSQPTALGNDADFAKRDAATGVT